MPNTKNYGPNAQAMIDQLRANHPSWLSAEDQADPAADPIAEAANGVMDLIGAKESSGNYDSIGTPGWKPLDAPPAAISAMTPRQIIAWQKSPGSTLETVSGPGPKDRSVAHPAVGLLQFKPNTLSQYAIEAGLLDEPFDPESQRKIGLVQMNHNGFSDYLNGQMSEADFTKEMAKTWATLPKDSSGNSHYGPKAPITFENWSNAIRAAKQAYQGASDRAQGGSP